MTYYILVIESCYQCNKRKTYIKSREPIESEIEGAKESIGGMFCITSYVTRLEVDGPGFDEKIHD